MEPHERMMCAIRHQQPDRAPIEMEEKEVAPEEIEAADSKLTAKILELLDDRLFLSG